MLLPVSCRDLENSCGKRPTGGRGGSGRTRQDSVEARAPLSVRDAEAGLEAGDAAADRK